MNVEIGNIIKDLLTPFVVGGSGSNQFIDKLAGVVKVISRQERNENEGTIIKYFPISCQTTLEDCSAPGKLSELIPNSKYGCIVYLEEDGGVEKIAEFNSVKQYKVSYLLVGWLNQKKLGDLSCSITGSVVNTIIGALSVKPFNNGIYQTIQIDVKGQNPKSINPFSKYSYDEENTKYLMHPFDYFSLKIDVTVNVNLKCIEPFQKNTEIIC
jgi:hypothetical protein